MAVFEKNAAPLAVHSSADLKRTELLDIERLARHWQRLIGPLHLALNRRYPLGSSAFTRVIDVAAYSADGNPVVAGYMFGKSHLSFDYVLLNTAFLGKRADFENVLQGLERNVSNGTYAPTDRADIAAITHELLHPFGPSR